MVVPNRRGVRAQTPNGRLSELVPSYAIHKGAKRQSETSLSATGGRHLMTVVTMPLLKDSDRVMTGCLPAVDVKNFSGNKVRRVEIQDRIDDF